MRSYRWGKFQGWVILSFGALGLLTLRSLLLLNLWGIVGVVVQIAAGYGIIRKLRVGIVLFYLCCALLGIGIFRVISLGAFPDSFSTIAIWAAVLGWWGIPAIFYYPKRWKDLNANEEPSLSEPPEGRNVETTDAMLAEVDGLSGVQYLGGVNRDPESFPSGQLPDAPSRHIGEQEVGQVVEGRMREGAKGQKAIMNFSLGMRRLAIFVGVLGAVAGGDYAYKDLHNLPSQRAQYKFFETLAASDVVKQGHAQLISLKAAGAEFSWPITTSITAKELTVPSETFNLSYAEPVRGVPPGLTAEPIIHVPKGFSLIDGPDAPQSANQDKSQRALPNLNSNRIKTIFWRNNLTVDFFVMDDDGVVVSSKPRSAWSYLLAVIFPVLGFFTLWGLISGIGWVGVGFFPMPHP